MLDNYKLTLSEDDKKELINNLRDLIADTLTNDQLVFLNEMCESDIETYLKLKSELSTKDPKYESRLSYYNFKLAMLYRISDKLNKRIIK